MPKIYRILIETEDVDNWMDARKIFDSKDSPMTTPYKYETKIINAWSRNVEANRDWKYIVEKSVSTLNLPDYGEI